MPHAARRTHVIERRARAPPRDLPPHAYRARPAARARNRRAPGRHSLSGRRGPSRGAEGRVRSPRRYALPWQGPALPPAGQGGGRHRRFEARTQRPPRLAARDRRARRVRRERAGDGDDGPRPRSGPAVLRRRARGRDGARGAGRLPAPARVCPSGCAPRRGPRRRRCRHGGHDVIGSGGRQGGAMSVGASAGAGPRSFVSLGGETVYSGRLVDVRHERYRHADGEEVGESDLLEIPAGRLDIEGEEPLAAAQRELAEEVGVGARAWEPIVTYYSSSGFTDERVHLFSATDLYKQSADSGENERIEVVRWPLERLGDAIAECRDAKTLIALLWLSDRLKD